MITRNALKYAFVVDNAGEVLFSVLCFGIFFETGSPYLLVIILRSQNDNEKKERFF